MSRRVETPFRALRSKPTLLRGARPTPNVYVSQGDLISLRRVLNPFTAQQVAVSRREQRRLELDPEGFTKAHMYTLKKVLQRLPRHVTTLRDQRYVRLPSLLALGHTRPSGYCSSMVRVVFEEELREVSLSLAHHAKIICLQRVLQAGCSNIQ